VRDFGAILAPLLGIAMVVLVIELLHLAPIGR
jgi:hypothetical protein